MRSRRAACHGPRAEPSHTHRHGHWRDWRGNVAPGRHRVGGDWARRPRLKQHALDPPARGSTGDAMAGPRAVSTVSAAQAAHCPASTRPHATCHTSSTKQYVPSSMLRTSGRPSTSDTCSFISPALTSASRHSYARCETLPPPPPAARDVEPRAWVRVRGVRRGGRAAHLVCVQRAC